MFCAHLSQNRYAVQLLTGRDLFYRRYDQPFACSHSFEDYQLDINSQVDKGYYEK